MSSISLAQDQIDALVNDTQGGTTNYVKGYNDILGFIYLASNDPGGHVLDPGTLYWYQHAPLINDATSTDPSKFFIQDVSEYGLRLDGSYKGNLQQISDAIASRVILDTINSGQIATLPNLLGQDIGQAIGQYNMTIGGWGGSFYYWNEVPVGPDGSVQQAVGAQIKATLQPGYDFDAGGQFDKFVAVNAAATSDSLKTSPFTTLSNAALYYLGLGAEIPFSISSQLFERSIDIGFGQAIVGSPNIIDSYVYTKGAWNDTYTVKLFFGSEQFMISPVTNSGLTSSLDAERGYRLAHQDVVGGTNTDLIGGTQPPTYLSPLQQQGALSDFDEGTTVNPDGSYASTIIVQSTDPANPGPLISTYLHAVDGHTYETSLQQVGSAIASVDLWNADGTGVLASETFTVAPGSAMLHLDSVFFNGIAGVGWSSDLIQFQPDGQTLSSLFISNSDGSGLLYNVGPGASDWNEIITKATGDLSLSITHGLVVYDRTQRTYVMGTRVADYQAGTTTTYLDGDPSAPSISIPADVPKDFASAQTLWNALLPVNNQAMA